MVIVRIFLKSILNHNPRILVFGAAAACALLLPACADTPPAKKRVEPTPPPIQFLVHAQTGAASKTMPGDALAQQASRIAEVPVRHEGVGPDGRHNLVLVCADLPACQAATQRLRVQPEYFAAIQEAPRAAFGPSNAKR